MIPVSWKDCGRKWLWHNLRHFSWFLLRGAEDNHEHSRSSKPVSRSGFEPRTSRTWSGSGNLSTMTSDTMLMNYEFGSFRKGCDPVWGNCSPEFDCDHGKYKWQIKVIPPVIRPDTFPSRCFVFGSFCNSFLFSCRIHVTVLTKTRSWSPPSESMLVPALLPVSSPHHKIRPRVIDKGSSEVFLFCACLRETRGA
jgi:hypothetical protein